MCVGVGVGVGVGGCGCGGEDGVSGVDEWVDGWVSYIFFCSYGWHFHIQVIYECFL